MTDSGWNCTPQTGYFRWRTAWISLASSCARAVTTSSRGSDKGAAIREWYRITSSGEGSPLNRSVPSCTTCDVFPCITRPARTTFPPYASTIAWWPRQTPRIGIVPPSCLTSGTEMPASEGVQGPGEITIAAGAIVATSWTVIRSFRKTSTSTPNSPRYWTRLNVNES